MPPLPNGWSHDEFGPRLPDRFMFDEGEGKIKTLSCSNTGVVIADVEANGAVGKGTGEMNQIESIRKAIFFHVGKLFDLGQTSERGKTKKRFESGVACGEVGCYERPAR